MRFISSSSPSPSSSSSPLSSPIGFLFETDSLQVRDVEFSDSLECLIGYISACRAFQRLKPARIERSYKALSNA